ncbi:MoaD/ThiS family protein [Candidatus Neomarinimicrobiota bacterium]
MSIKFEFLGPLKVLVGGQESVEVEAATIVEALEKLNDQFGAVNQRLLEESGSLHRHINIYVNEVDIRQKDQLNTRLSDGDVATVISAIAGGWR